VDQQTGTVTLPASTRNVTVQFSNPPTQ
jgi:hypothetical protein